MLHVFFPSASSQDNNPKYNPECMKHKITSHIANCYKFTHWQFNFTNEIWCLFLDNNQSLPDDSLLECSDSFYRENGSQVCVPSCYSWSQYGRNLSIGIDAVVIFMAVIGGSASITILIISCLKLKRM